VQNFKLGAVNLDAPATTLCLLRLDAVVGVRGLFDSSGAIKSSGFTCALCHSTVDNSLALGIGWNLHSAEELSIDGFQADRAPIWWNT
jgi:hypothetical protein